MYKDKNRHVYFSFEGAILQWYNWMIATIFWLLSGQTLLHVPFILKSLTTMFLNTNEWEQVISLCCFKKSLAALTLDLKSYSGVTKMEKRSVF